MEKIDINKFLDIQKVLDNSRNITSETTKPVNTNPLQATKDSMTLEQVRRREKAINSSDGTFEWRGYTRNVTPSSKRAGGADTKVVKPTETSPTDNDNTSVMEPKSTTPTIFERKDNVDYINGVPLISKGWYDTPDGLGYWNGYKPNIHHQKSGYKYYRRFMEFVKESPTRKTYGGSVGRLLRTVEDMRNDKSRAMTPAEEKLLNFKNIAYIGNLDNGEQDW